MAIKRNMAQDCDKDIVYRATQTRPIGTQWCTEITVNQGKQYDLPATEFIQRVIIYLNCLLMGSIERRRNKEKRNGKRKSKQENRLCMPSPHYFSFLTDAQAHSFSEWVITHHRPRALNILLHFAGE